MILETYSKFSWLNQLKIFKDFWLTLYAHADIQIYWTLICIVRITW